MEKKQITSSVRCEKAELPTRLARLGGSEARSQQLNSGIRFDDLGGGACQKVGHRVSAMKGYFDPQLEALTWLYVR